MTILVSEQMEEGEKRESLRDLRSGVLDITWNDVRRRETLITLHGRTLCWTVKKTMPNSVLLEVGPDLLTDTLQHFTCTKM